ncbi:MAG TPA: family 10 glycosylhydrolase, partial [Armatimonadota bacterium]|nr:family 10 glycosylhydrolase [Armatimonadota bacterium]
MVALPLAAWPVDIVLVRGGSIYDGITESLLTKSGVEYEPMAQDQLAERGLSGYRLAIFPLAQNLTKEAAEAVLTFVQGGGKLIYMSNIPPLLQDTLGIGKWQSRGKEYPGEFGVMVFSDDRPPGFPAQVHQESPNSRIVEETAGSGRVIANWHDTAGKDTGIPAVIITPDTVWTAHVFWAGANADEQRHLLLASIGYLLPDALGDVVEGLVRKGIAATGYESADALVAAAAGNPVARQFAEKARDEARRALEAAKGATPAEGLELAERARSDGQMAACALYPSRPYELRGFWMHPDDGFDYEATMQQLADANFNAVFPIVCGPNYTKYPSDFAPQYTERDHVADCIAAAHRHGIEVHLWKANWQASASRNPEVLQQFVADGRAVVSVEQARGEEEKSSYQWSNKWLDPSDDRNRDLEFDMMMELVENYHPDGIHFDFMRYPDGRYCYCDRCRAKFQEWAQVTVANWPDDCYDGGELVGRYRDWRRFLMTTMVERIAEGARERDPDIKISLAARSSMSGSYEGDAQDWVTWAHEHYLDLLCPMDYTGSVDQLRDRVKPQVEAVAGAIPIYAGLGVSPGRSDSPVNLSQQVVAARDLGADGFLIFALSPFSMAMLPDLKVGVTSQPVTVMPHHQQSAVATFTYPEPIAETAPRAYAPGVDLPVTIAVSATEDGVQQLTVQALMMPAAGGDATALTQYQSTDKPRHELQVTLRPAAGAWSIILQGEVVFEDGHEEPFYLRSLPLRVLSDLELEDLRALTTPPKFATGDLHVGVTLEGYGSRGILAALRETPG